MKHIILAAIAAISIAGLSGCGGNLASDTAAFNKATTTATSDESKIETDANALAVTTTGTVPQEVANWESYANTSLTALSDFGQFASTIEGLFTTKTTMGRVWNARGIAACHRFHINPRDRYAIAKLERILSGQRLQATDGGDAPKNVIDNATCPDGLPAQKPSTSLTDCVVMPSEYQFYEDARNGKLLSTPFASLDFSAVKAAQCRPIW